MPRHSRLPDDATGPRVTRRRKQAAAEWITASEEIDAAQIGPGATLMLEGRSCRAVNNKVHCLEGDGMVTVKSIKREVCRYAEYRPVLTLTFVDPMKTRRGTNKNSVSGVGKCIWHDPELAEDDQLRYQVVTSSAESALGAAMLAGDAGPRAAMSTSTVPCAKRRAEPREITDVPAAARSAKRIRKGARCQSPKQLRASVLVMGGIASACSGGGSVSFAEPTSGGGDSTSTGGGSSDAAVNLTNFEGEYTYEPEERQSGLLGAPSEWLWNFDLEFLARIPSATDRSVLATDVVVESSRCIKQTFEEYVQPGRWCKQDGGAVHGATYDTALRHKLGSDGALRAEGPLLPQWERDDGGSPTLDAVFKEGKPMIFQYVVGGDHFRTLAIIPERRTVVHADGLFASGLDKMFLRAIRRAIDKAAAAGLCEAANNWSVVTNLGVVRGQRLQQDAIVLPGDKTGYDNLAGRAFQCGVWSRYFTEVILQWLVDDSGADLSCGVVDRSPRFHPRVNALHCTTDPEMDLSDNGWCSCNRYRLSMKLSQCVVHTVPTIMLASHSLRCPGA